MLQQAIRKVMPTYGYEIAPRSVLMAELERTKFTPDIAKLEEYEWQAVFVCDELKHKFAQHHLLGEERQYCFPAYTQKSFHYWQSNNPWEGAIPFEVSIIRNNVVGWPPIAKIKGEVYLIRPQRFLDIDTYKENTVQYARKRTRLVIPYRHVKWVRDPSVHHFFSNPEQYFNRSTLLTEEITCIVSAWMYHGHPDHWDPLITAYDYGHVETFHSQNRTWLPEYYHIRRPKGPPPVP